VPPLLGVPVPTEGLCTGETVPWLPLTVPAPLVPPGCVIVPLLVLVVVVLLVECVEVVELLVVVVLLPPSGLLTTVFVGCPPLFLANEPGLDAAPLWCCCCVVVGAT
jgi:hypothetical protein